MTPVRWLLKGALYLISIPLAGIALVGVLVLFFVIDLIQGECCD